VTGVVESHLKQQKEAGGEGPWLVGNRFSYADLAWVPWQKMFMDMTPKEEIDFDDYPLVQDWIKRLGEQKGIKKVLDIGMMPPKGK
jgi:glutathione S-transferase